MTLSQHCAFAVRLMLAAALIGTMSIVGSTPARANTTFANCSDLNGHVFFRDHSSTIISENNTIAQLNDGDAISIAIRFTSGAVGQITGAVAIDGATLFTETVAWGVGPGLLILGTEVNRTVSYDPPSDGTNVPLVFTTLPFTSLEGFVTFTVTCVTGAASSAVPAATATKTFAVERARRLLEERPDRPRYLRKRLQALWGGTDAGTIEQADALTAANSRARNSAARRAAVPPRQSEQRSVQVASVGNAGPLVGMAARDNTLKAYGYGAADVAKECDAERPSGPRLSCINIWTEGHYTRFKDRGDRDGHFAVVYAGADIHLTPWVIAGLMGQVDWMVDDIGTIGTRTEGVGWMVGPYASMRLTPQLFFDVRAAWGLSDTDVNAAGITGNVATERWLATAQLSGNFHVGNYRVTPEASVEYIQDKLDAYTVSSGATVASQTVSIGRFRAGPEIARQFELDSGLIIEPRAALAGVWDFDPADTATLGNVTYGDERFRGVAEAGVIIQGTNGMNIAISGKYEGIGISGFDAYGAYVWVNVLL